MGFMSAIRLSVRMSWGSERALDMPEGRRLEGATGPADGLGGKRFGASRPVPVRRNGARVTVRTAGLPEPLSMKNDACCGVRDA